MSAALTRDELIALWRRDMDPGYTIPLEDEEAGRGLDVIAGLAALLSRVSLSVQTTTQALYLKPHSTQLSPPASGGVKATGSIEVSLATPANGDLLVLARELTDGSATFDAPRALVQRTGPDGNVVDAPRLDTLSPPGPLTFIPAGTTGPLSFSVRAERQGFQGNVGAGLAVAFERRGSHTAIVSSLVVAGAVASLEIDASGDIFGPRAAGQYVRFLDGPNAGKPVQLIYAQTDSLNVALLHTSEVLVSQAGGTIEVLDAADLGLTGVTTTAIAGGRDAELDFIALERNAGRTTGETDEEFRQRLCRLDDRVSPAALQRTLENLLDPAGVDFQLIEVAETNVGLAFFPEVSPANTGHAFDDPNAFAKRRFFSPLGMSGAKPRGFLVVINGAQLPLDEDERNSLLARLIRAIRERKGGGVPWGIAFEPAIGDDIMGPSLTLGLAVDTLSVAGATIPFTVVLEQGGSPAIAQSAGAVTLLGGRGYLIELTIGVSSTGGFGREAEVFDKTTGGGTSIPGLRCRVVTVTGGNNVSAVATRRRIYRPPTNVDIDARWVTGGNHTALVDYCSLTVIDMGPSL